MIKSVWRHLSRIWLLGTLFFLFVLGYILYGFILVIRMAKIKKVIYLASALLLASLLAAHLYCLFLPLGNNDSKVEIIIPRGATVAAIADSLKNHKIITSTTALRLWMKLKGTERKIQAGKITCNVGEGVFRASKNLLNAKPIEVVFTINEGLTIEQTAERIAQVMEIDTAQFNKLCYDTAFIKELGLSVFSLEGYLFPDTYRFPKDATIKEIIRKMVQHFDNVYSSLQADTSVISRYNRHQIVTIASIVEKEATVAWERARIAGVFHNRLKLGYPLGADPTVRYALRKFNGPLKVSELNSSSPYNTRKYTGLPPGPICSPGKASLQAAMTPADTKDLYFVAKWDGSGEHDFSRTNEEHTRKKLLIRRQNEIRKKGPR